MPSTTVGRDSRAGVPLPHGRLGERGKDVERGHGAGHVAHAPETGGHRVAQLVDDLPFPREGPFLRSQDPCLVLLELRGHVAFGVGQRLPPLIVLGHGPPVALRHLDVVPEDLVVPDLEGRNAGSLPFGGLDTCDVALSAVAEIASLVQLGVRPHANSVTIAQRRRRLVDQRPRHEVR